MIQKFRVMQSIMGSVVYRLTEYNHFIKIFFHVKILSSVIACC